jgi:hypothetical protein
LLKKLLLLTLAAGTICACSGGRLRLGRTETGEVVEAEGWVPSDAKDLAGTRQRALAEAQRKAVERVVGVYISAKTRVAQAVDVDQNILARVGGYIRKYDVLSEKEENGLFKTRIKAVVLYDKIGQDLRRAGLTGGSGPAGNPRLAVLIATIGEYSEATDGRAAQGVRRGFLAKNFEVVDRNDPAAFGNRRSTDSVSALVVGRELSADLIVRGEAQAYPLQDPRLGGFFSYRARVTLEVLRPSGQVVAAKTMEASALDPAPQIAQAKALDTAGQLAGESLAGELADILAARTNVVLRVRGLGMGALQRFEEDVRLLPEVVDVTLSSFDRERGAELSVRTSRMSGEELAAEILRMRKYSCMVNAVSAYEVDVAVTAQ